MILHPSRLPDATGGRQFKHRDVKSCDEPDAPHVEPGELRVVGQKQIDAGRGRAGEVNIVSQ